MARGSTGVDFTMNGQVRDFAFEVAQEIASDLKNPVFPTIVVQGKQNLIKADHGNDAGSLHYRR